MRLLAGVAAAFGCCIAGGALAQPAPHSNTARLMNAAFAPDHRPTAAKEDPLATILERETYRPGAGPMRWNTNQIKLGESPSGTVDSLRISLGGALRTPGGVPLNLDRAEFQPDAYEVAITRDWPAAVRFEAGDYDLDVTPHAGFGVSNIGGQAEAGATLTVGQRTSDAVEARLKGMVQDGAAFGNEGRWYLFAAASGQAVGLNVLRNDGDWNRAGWSTDPSSALIGDAQVGVGWRKGPMQTSFGYIHREVKGEHMLFGQTTREDSVVAFSLSIKPGR